MLYSTVTSTDIMYCRNSKWLWVRLPIPKSAINTCRFFLLYTLHITDSNIHDYGTIDLSSLNSRDKIPELSYLIVPLHFLTALYLVDGFYNPDFIAMPYGLLSYFLARLPVNIFKIIIAYEAMVNVCGTLRFLESRVHGLVSLINQGGILTADTEPSHCSPLNLIRYPDTIPYLTTYDSNVRAAALKGVEIFALFQIYG